MMQLNYNSKQYVQNIKEYYDTWIKEDESSKFDSSKIKGSVVLTRDFNDLGMGVSLPKDNVNDPSELLDYLLVLLGEIRSEDESSELSRRRNIRRYAYFYESYKQMLELAALEPKKFGETNALKAKRKVVEEQEEQENEDLEETLQNRVEHLTSRQWRSYKTSAERIHRLWNICNKKFPILDLIITLTPNFFERLANKATAERWFIIIEQGVYYTQKEYKELYTNEEEFLTRSDSSSSRGKGKRNKGKGKVI